MARRWDVVLEAFERPPEEGSYEVLVSAVDPAGNSAGARAVFEINRAGPRVSAAEAYETMPPVIDREEIILAVEDGNGVDYRRMTVRFRPGGGAG